MRIAVRHRRNIGRGHAAKIEQRITLRRRAIRRDRLAFALRRREKPQQGLAAVLDAFRKTQVCGEIGQARRALRGAQRAELCAVFEVRTLRMRGIDSQRPAVRRQALRIVEPQAVAAEHLLDGIQREIRVMLVINGVEFDLFDQFEQMRELDRRRAVGLEQPCNPRHEVIEQRHMRQHVVGDDQVGLPAVRNQLLGQTLAEELHQGGNADFFRSRRDGTGRIDAEHRHAHVNEVLQQVPIVAREFHDQAVFAEAEPVPRHFAVRFGVRQPVVRVGREIHVVAEQFLRRDVVVHLHQFAGFANLGAQRIALLVARIGQRRDEGIRCGLQPQIGHGHGQAAAACATAAHGTYH